MSTDIAFQVFFYDTASSAAAQAEIPEHIAAVGTQSVTTTIVQDPGIARTTGNWSPVPFDVVYTNVTTTKRVAQLRVQALNSNLSGDITYQANGAYGDQPIKQYPYLAGISGQAMHAFRVLIDDTDFAPHFYYRCKINSQTNPWGTWVVGNTDVWCGDYVNDCTIASIEFLWSTTPPTDIVTLTSKAKAPAMK